MTDADSPLFEAATLFALGNYQSCINEALKTRLPDEERLHIEKDVLVYRSYVSQQNYLLVLNEIEEADHTPPALRTVRLLAQFMANPADKERSFAQLAELMNTEAGGDPLVQIVAATMHFVDQNHANAMRIANQCELLEGRALMVQLYLATNRVDLAAKEYARMQTVDDDAVYTQLACAWVNMAQGGKKKFQEGAYIFQELVDKFQPTPLLLNGQASCNIHLEQLDEAEKLLLEALEKDNKNPETLVNLIVCAAHLGKSPDLINRYLNQLKAQNQSHPWVERLQLAEEQFETNAARFAV